MAGSGSHRQLIGERVGRYRVSDRLGCGGMAEVWRASDDKLGRDVALKVVLPLYASEDQFLERFLREARVVASLEHPNILPVYDFGEHEGVPFLVMPLIRGGTLADRMQGEPIEPGRVVVWVRELAAALDAAHAEGVLHRDVKPGNVLVGREERLFLGDFGIAKLFDATRLTRTGTVVGTPMYMAPEVAGGKPAAAPADRYSLAVMAYELLAGSPPFEGENVLSILHQHATHPVPPISARVRSLPGGIDRALEAGLAKDPAARPTTCRAFADMLGEELSELTSTSASAAALPVPISDRVPTLALDDGASGAGSRPTALTEIATPPASDAYETALSPRGAFGRVWQWAAAGLVGGVVAVMAFSALRGSDPPTESVASTPPRGTQVVATQPEETPPATQPAATQPVETPPEETPPEEIPPEEVPTPEKPSGESVQSEPATSRPIRNPAGRASGRRSSGSKSRLGGRPGSPLQVLRSFTKRTTADDLEQVLDAVRGMPRRGSKAAQAEALERYAKGGLAYLGGDDRAARATLGELTASPRFVASWGPSPLMLLASSASSGGKLADWELALGYGDAKAIAGGELDRLLLHEPENPRYRFARALVHRLDGEHSAVVRDAVPVFHTLGGKDGPEARNYLALIVGEAYLGLGRGGEALTWFRRAVEIGGPFRGVSALRAAEAAFEVGELETAVGMLKVACEAKIQPACERLARQSGGR